MRSDKIRAANGVVKQEQTIKPVEKTVSKAEVKPAAVKSGVSKLNAKERQELEVLPVQIEHLETEQTDIGVEMSNPELYKNKPELAANMQARLLEITADLEQKMQRWEFLLQRAET